MLWLDSRNATTLAGSTSRYPPLHGRTPRAAARTAAGRAELELLLKQMEHMENRSPGVPFDFSALRRALRVDPT